MQVRKKEEVQQLPCSISPPLDISEVPRELCKSPVACVNPVSVLGFLICKHMILLLTHSDNKPTESLKSLPSASTRQFFMCYPGGVTSQSTKCPAWQGWDSKCRAVISRLPQAERPGAGAAFHFLFLPGTVRSTELPRKQSLWLVR